MAFLRKRNNIFHIVYYDDFGKKKSFSTKTNNRTTANYQLRKFNAQKELNLPFEIYGQDKTERIAFSIAYKEFINSKERTADTIRSYDGIKNRWIQIVGEKFVKYYTPEDCKKFVTSLSKLSKNSLESYTRQLSIIFNFFVKKNYISENPIEITKGSLKEPQPMTLGDYEKIRKYFLDRKMIKQYNLVSLIFFNALRVSEGIFMRGEDFDFENKLVYIRNSKGKRIDMIPMLKDAEEFLRTMNMPDGRLFDYTSRDSFKTVWNGARHKTNVTNTVHSLRKARGTQLANLGVEPLFLQKFMRHRDIKTTLKFYVKMDLNNMRERINGKI